MAAAVPAKSADPVPVPRAKPAAAATFQLASADAQIVPLGKPSKPAAPPAAAKNEAKPETPADIINARGFWGDAPATAKQATPEQIAALRGPPGRRWSRPAIDRQHLRRVPGAGLCAGGGTAG